MGISWLFQHVAFAKAIEIKINKAIIMLTELTVDPSPTVCYLRPCVSEAFAEAIDSAINQFGWESLERLVGALSDALALSSLVFHSPTKQTL